MAWLKGYIIGQFQQLRYKRSRLKGWPYFRGGFSRNSQIAAGLVILASLERKRPLSLTQIALNDPYVSTNMPMIGQPIRTRMMPPKKNVQPFSL